MQTISNSNLPVTLKEYFEISKKPLIIASGLGAYL